MSNVRKSYLDDQRVLEEFGQVNEDADLLFSDNKGKDFIINALGETRPNNLVKLLMSGIPIHLSPLN